jgi:hypothetical protein
MHGQTLRTSQLVTPLLLGMDFCMDNHVVINFPKKTIVINSDDEESATEVDLVNERRNIDSSIDSPVNRAINLGTAELPPTQQLDRIAFGIFHLAFVIPWPVLSGLCSLFSDRILQDLFSTTWMISLYIQIPMKNTSDTWMPCLGKCWQK